MKHALVPGALVTLSVAAFLCAVRAQDGSGGNAGPAGSAVPAARPLPSSSSAGPPPINLVVSSPNTGGTDGVLVRISSFAASIFGSVPFSAISGLSRTPGTTSYFASGGMSDGGNLYKSAGPTLVLVGATGFTSVPGLAWDVTGTTLYGSAAVTTIGDGLISISPVAGGGTLIGAGYGGPSGVDAIAQSPITGVMYGSTGFLYDGSPGDVLTIDLTTGLATDTGLDFTDGGGGLPAGTVAGMAFRSTTGKGFLTIGGGIGDVYEFSEATFTITLLGNIGTGSSGSDVEVHTP